MQSEGVCVWWGNGAGVRGRRGTFPQAIYIWLRKSGRVPAAVKWSGSRLKAIFLEVSLQHTTTMCSFLARLSVLMLQNLDGLLQPAWFSSICFGREEDKTAFWCMCECSPSPPPPLTSTRRGPPDFWDLDKTARSYWTTRSRMCVSVEETEAMRGKGIKNFGNNPNCICQTQPPPLICCS